MEATCRWTTLRRLRDPSEAEELRAYLEAHDIPCFLDSLQTVALYWLVSDAIGGIRVQVPEDRVEEAEQLLHSVLSDEDQIRLEEQAAPAGQTDTCPQCGSRNLRLDRLERMTKSLSLLIQVPFAVGRNLWICEDCGHSYRSQRTATRWFVVITVMPIALLWYVGEWLVHVYRQLLATLRGGLGLGQGQAECWSCHGELPKLGGRCPHCSIELPTADLYRRCVDATREDYDTTCEHCHVPYSCHDYEAGAEEWKCSGCGQPLPRS